jgi:hypothetical protein
MKDEWKERALRELVPGARVRIVTSPRGDFDDGVEIIIDSVDSADGWVCYHYPEDFVWNDPHSGESFPMGEMFGGGETGLEPFCDPQWLQWEVVRTPQ